jgi:hypothetical protein
MYFYLYKITNLINNKIYIGVHKTNNLDDGYMGSGKVISNAIKKHGIENFKKEILEFFENSKEMFEKEKIIVTEEFLSNSNVYNIRRGGLGGFDHINKDKSLIQKRNKKVASNRNHEKQINALNRYRNENADWREKASHTFKEIFKNKPGNFSGKSHSDETKEKIGTANSKHQTGKSNSQFGTMWITNGQENKKIKKESVIPEGWYKGRRLG